MPQPFIPVPNCVRSSMVYLLDGQVIVNTYHFRLNTDPSIIDMGNLNTALHTWYTATLKPLLSPQTVLTQINTINLTTQNGPASVLSINPFEAGTGGANDMPANVTWCASLRTLNRGRNFRGRWYLPGLQANSVVAPSTIVTGFANSVIAALAQLMTPANVAGFAYVVVSRFLNNLPRGTGINTLITAVTGDLTLDSQRRRLPGRGA